ncbi:MAG: TetR/AcrR family transcriptional regulator [Stenotrophomonas sp.]
MTMLQSDAAAHRARIIDAADPVFSERGLKTPPAPVVECARFGAAMRYRHFPHRAGLMQAPLQRATHRVTTHVDTLGEHDFAVSERCDGIAGRIVSSPAPAPADDGRAAGASEPVIRAARQQLLERLRAPLQRARKVGSGRPDLQLPAVSTGVSGRPDATPSGKDRTPREPLPPRAIQLLRTGLDGRCGGAAP